MALAGNSWHYTYAKIAILLVCLTIGISAQFEDHVSRPRFYAVPRVFCAKIHVIPILRENDNEFLKPHN